MMPHQISSFMLVFQLIDQTEAYFFRKGSAFLSQAKEPLDTVTAESKRLKKKTQKLKLKTNSASIRRPKQQRTVKVVSCEDKLTETGVMAHNVCFKVITSKKLFQALFGHCRLKHPRPV